MDSKTTPIRSGLAVSDFSYKGGITIIITLLLLLLLVVVIIIIR